MSDMPPEITVVVEGPPPPIQVVLSEASIAWLRSYVDGLFGRVGALGNLTTDDKNTIVGAVSEVDGALDAHVAAEDPHPQYETAGEAQTKATAAQTAAATYTDTAVAAEAAARAAAISAALANLVSGAPGLLDTLDELAAALADDPNFATTMTTALAGKQPLDADLSAIAALSTTTIGRSLLAAADAAALRAILGLATVAATGAYTDLSGTPTLGTAAAKNTGTASGDVPLLGTGGRLAIARVASGTPDGTKFVRDDGTLAVPAGGGSSVSVSTRGYASGRFYLPDGVGISANNYFNMVANRLYAAGVYCPRADVTVASWMISISAGSAGSTIKAGLWNVGTDGLPTTLHTDLGSKSAASSGTTAVSATATILAGTPVILGFVAQGGTPQVPNVVDTAGYRWGTETANAGQVAAFGYSGIVAMGLASDGVSGALGAWPSTFITGNAVPQPRAGLAFA